MVRLLLHACARAHIHAGLQKTAGVGVVGRAFAFLALTLCRVLSTGSCVHRKSPDSGLLSGSGYRFPVFLVVALALLPGEAMAEPGAYHTLWPYNGAAGYSVDATKWAFAATPDGVCDIRSPEVHKWAPDPYTGRCSSLEEIGYGITDKGDCAVTYHLLMWGFCGDVDSITSSGAFYPEYALCSTIVGWSEQIPKPYDICGGYYVTATPPSNCDLCVGDPINPASGAVIKSETDVEVRGSNLAFRRFYSSIVETTTGLSRGWRHSYSRSISASNQNVRQRRYEKYAAGKSSKLYMDAATACTSGFADIKVGVSTWANATATFADGICSLSVNGANIGTLNVFYGPQQMPEPGPTPVRIDAIRDDGQLVSFVVQGGVIKAPPGIAMQLTQAAGGYLLTDEDDNVERYDENGRLLSVTSRGGVVETLSYDSAGRLSGITDSFGRNIALSYDSQNRLIAVIDPAQQTTEYGYDTKGRLSTINQPDVTSRTYLYGNTAFPYVLTGMNDESGIRYSTWTYDSLGRAIKTQEAGGAGAVSLTYNPDRTVRTTDALGASRTFTFGRYGDRNLVTEITGSQCPTCAESWRTTYGTHGFPTSSTDYRRFVTRYAYNGSRGLEVSRTEAYGTARARTITTQWHSSYRLPTSLSLYNGGSASGTPLRTASFAYDSSGNLLTRTVTDPAIDASRTWSYSYDRYGRVTTVDGPRTDVSDVTTYAYYDCSSGSECGQLHTVTDAAGHVTTYNAYNAYGQPLTVTDPNGVVTTLAYDARQRLTALTVGSETTSFEYWPTGLLKKATLPDGSYLEYGYDAAHRLTQIQDADGNSVVYTLDAMGNRVAEKTYDPANTLARSRSRVYNSLNQLWKEVSASGTTAQQTVYTYDADGNPLIRTAPLARKTTNVYDELDRLIQVTNPASGITKYGYDANDNLVSVTDPRNLVTSYQYNGLGDLTRLISPDTKTTVNGYDAAGNLATRTDARGKTATYAYDALNRLVSATFSDQVIAYSYDQGENGRGRLTGVSDSSGQTAWSYDAVGRVTRRQYTVGEGSATLAKALAAAGDLSPLTLPSGRVVTRGPVNAMLNSRQQALQGVATTVTYAYDAAGRLSVLTLPSGHAVTYGYTNGKLTSLTLDGSTGILSGVLYDPFGPPRAWTWGDGTASTRGYDLDGNLAYLDGALAGTYVYDNAFRITGITDATGFGSSWNYGYDSLDRLVSAAGASSLGWTYDANGNRLSQTGSDASTFTMVSGSNRLGSSSGALARTYSYDAAGNATGDGSFTFTYDDAGRMIAATRAGVTTSYTYNALNQRISKTDSSGTTYFAYDEAGHLLGEYDQYGALIQETVWMDDIPVAVLKPTGNGAIDVFYIHTDHLDTPRRITRAGSSMLVWKWDSSPFGADAADENPSGYGTFAFNLRFPGQYYDAETGLYYNWNRYYDPRIGRYITSDPIGLAGGLNTYAYVSSNPMTWTDPSGLLMSCVQLRSGSSSTIICGDSTTGETVTYPVTENAPPSSADDPNGPGGPLPAGHHELRPRPDGSDKNRCPNGAPVYTTPGQRPGVVISPKGKKRGGEDGPICPHIGTQSEGCPLFSKDDAGKKLKEDFYQRFFNNVNRGGTDIWIIDLP